VEKGKRDWKGEEKVEKGKRDWKGSNPLYLLLPISSGSLLISLSSWTMNK
jgi:hypothetical protein